MSILKGVMSFTRFNVKCDTKLSVQEVVEKINLFRFRPLDPRGEDSETLGFCPFLNEYDDEKSIEVGDLFYDDLIILSMRSDTLSVPKELLRSLTKKSMQAYVRDHKRLPDRTIKKEIELAEIKGLRGKILPKTKITECTWCQESQELRVFSRAPSTIDRFLELFQQTFMLKPERQDFAVKAFRFGKDNHEAIAVEALGHEPLYVPPLRVDIQ